MGVLGGGLGKGCLVAHRVGDALVVKPREFLGQAIKVGRGTLASGVRLE